MIDADAIRARHALSDIVGRRVKLRRQGREFSGLCPFHNEKSPSFFVNDSKAFYHCFGCGKHGDVLDFIQATENLAFLDAVAWLGGGNWPAVNAAPISVPLSIVPKTSIVTCAMTGSFILCVSK